MATSTIKQSNEIKTATATITTSAVGSGGIPQNQKPADFHTFIALIDNSKAGSHFVVQFNANMFGFYSYDPPHNPYVGEVTISYAYI